MLRLAREQAEAEAVRFEGLLSTLVALLECKRGDAKAIEGVKEQMRALLPSVGGGMADLPADAPRGTVSCGDLRREPDGRWFFGTTYLGRDGEPMAVMVGSLGDRLGVVAARLAEALGQTCDAMDGWGDALAVQTGRDTLRRFERWKVGRSW
ncbi:MAG: hypothetical protein ACRBN8_43855 [Nannocystales bacterium]